MTAQELYDKGFELRCGGSYGEARDVLQRVLEQEADHADAKWQLGLIKGFEGDFESSVALLTQVVAGHPGHVSARYDLAMSLMMLGSEKEACGHFREVLRLNPEHEKAKQQIMFCQ